MSKNGNDDGGFVLESVDSIEIKVDKSDKSADRSPLPEKEWLLAEIYNIQKQLPSSKDFKPSLNWEFHFKEESLEGRKIWMNTSLIASLNSKLYGYYLAVMGLKDFDDGAIIKPADMIGKWCYVMIVPSTKKKGKQVVHDLKYYDGKVDKKDKINEVKPSDEKKESVAKKQVEKQEKENDEVKVDDIDLDNL
jgi:hypothetical protein